MKQGNKTGAQLPLAEQTYEVFSHPAAENLQQVSRHCNILLPNVARSLLLTDGHGALLMAVFPASHCIDIPALGRQLQRILEPAPTELVEALFPGLNPDMLPPFSQQQVLPCIIDAALAEKDQVYFPVSQQQIVRVDNEDFHNLLDHAWHGFSFSYPLPGYDAQAPKQDLIVLPRLLEQRLTVLDALPGIPETARLLLRLMNREGTRVTDLSHIIDQDPFLSAQLLRQARSALYGFGSEIKTVKQAILQIFGYETCLHMALGMSTAVSFKGPVHGPLGQQRCYRDAVMVATLAEALARKMPISRRPEKGSAHLAGLLHNIGYLLLAHLFRDEYNETNELASDEAGYAPWEYIQTRFRALPEHISSWLMETWEMPMSLTVAIREQRNPHYRGRHASHARLVLLANRLLDAYDFGDAGIGELPVNVLEELGLDEKTAMDCTERVIDSRAELGLLAEQFAA